MRLFLVPRRWSNCLALCSALALAVGLLLLWLYLPTLAPLVLAEGARQPTEPVDDEDRTVFTYDDGLAANSVTALLRDERSLWAGTTAGLSRYILRGPDTGLVWQTFTAADGMAADAVSDLWTDNDSGLWVAHPEGQISFFDGSAWTSYANLTQTLETAYDQIVASHASGPLWAVEEGGRVWTLAEGTIGYYVGAVWRPYGEDAGIPSGRLVAVWTGDGAWVASENGQIGYFDGAAWTTFRNVFDAVQRQYETIVASGPTVGPLWLVDQEGAVWVRNAFNQRNPRPDVRRFAEGRWTNFNNANGMASGFVAELRLDEYGRIWTRHVADENGQGGGLSLYTPQTGQGADAAGVTGWRAIVPAFTGNVTDFWPEGPEGVWVASASDPLGGDGVPVGGLTHVALNTWQRFSLATLEGGVVSATWLDENKDLRLGLTSDARRGARGGLLRYRQPLGIQPSQLTRVEGLLNDDVSDLWGDGQGSLWVATAAGVNRINLRNHQIFSYTRPAGIDQIAGDAEGNVWAVALGEESNVWQWNGSVWVSHTISEGLTSTTSQGKLSGGSYADMLVSATGDVYLAGDRGLEIWDGDKWKTFAALPGRNIKRIWQDAVGDLWLATVVTPGRPFYLSLNQGGGWETVLNESGSQEMGLDPLAFVRDAQGRAWLGAPLGLFLYKPGKDARWRGLGPVEGLPSGPVPVLYQDEGGTVWVAIGNQVYRTDCLHCTGAQSGWEWRRFDPEVGIVSHIAAGPEGSVLFAGDAGIALYDPTRPHLRLDGVVNLITNQAADGGGPVVLTLGRNAMRIDLVAIAPALTARQLSYRYRLQGFDDNWRVLPASSMGGKQASITYAGLPGGTYTFTASVRTNTLDHSPNISFTLHVLSRPPQLVLDQATVAGRPAEQPGTLETFVEQPIQIQLSGDDDQPEPLIYRYRIEGLSDVWTETTSPQISFTLSAVGTYTFVAKALDGEGQSSTLVGSQIVVSAKEQAGRSSSLPVESIAVGLGLLAVLLIAMAFLLIARRKRRESW